MYSHDRLLPSRRVSGVMRITLLSMVGLLSACGSREDAQVLGTVERDRLELVAEAHEPIAEVLVHEGDHVAAAQVLLRQSAGAMQPRLEQAQAQLDRTEQQLRELRAGVRRQEIEQARAALAAAISAQTVAELEFKRVEQVVQAKLQSQAALDQARAARDAATAARTQAQARLSLLNEGTRTEQIAQASAAVTAARAALAELQVSAARYELTAPRAGVIEALPYKLGERPPAGQPLVVMLADGATYARVYVPEMLRASFQPGTAVTVHADDLTDDLADGAAQPLRGQVRYISAQAAFTPYYALTQKDRGRLSYLAEITLPEAADLPAGLPVQVQLATPVTVVP